MNDEQKNRIIAEALNLCWHTPGKSTIKTEDGDYQCTKCKKWFEFCDSEHWNPKFSTWPGFGIIMERGQAREWWESFTSHWTVCGWTYKKDFIHISLINALYLFDELSTWLEANPEKWRAEEPTDPSKCKSGTEKIDSCSGCEEGHLCE